MSLRFAARYLGLFADPAEVASRAPRAGAGDKTESLAGAAKNLGLQAHRISTDWAGLQSMSLPAIAHLKDGSFLVVGRFTDGKVLVQHAAEGRRPQLLGQAEFDAIWGGNLILIRRPTGLARLASILGLKW